MTVAAEDIAAAIATTRVDFREVGLREGLQSHGLVVPTAQKRTYFEALAAAGCREQNVVSFVHPVTMPQMADAERFLESLGDLREGMTLSGLVPNDRGLDRAVAMAEAGLLDTVFLVFAESESTLQANRMTSDEEALLEQIDAHSRRAAAAGLAVSVFVSAAYGCSLEGRVPRARVVEHAARIQAMKAVSEVIISDSTGQADPLQVARMLADLATVLPIGERLGIHLHDTRGAGLANAFAALTSPFRHLVFDAAFGGWGGDWPFIPEAFGNIASEDLLEMFVGLGLDCGVDVAAVMAVTRDYAELSGRPIGAKLVEAAPIAWKRARRDPATGAAR